ncbi:hypothetical protein Taro_006850 [Colocasia esculenta]|uniref:DUF4219 domain-containing protein n=1 Tax=Colocasia esculenta TaxID=4460 RepID=A0A843TY54_COLES|nr:hypothetical protein [Colocasia esculenta]
MHTHTHLHFRGLKVTTRVIKMRKRPLPRPAVLGEEERTGTPTQSPHAPKGDNYTYWKTRMEFFLQGLDYQIWSIVEEGDLLVTNEKDKWTEDDKKKISLNCKAKSILCCALSKKEFNRIFACKSAMEMWEKLRITYEGTGKVKETRIDILKPGHIKAECPKLKKAEFRKKDSSRKLRRFKKKSMAAAWDNSSDSDSKSSSSNEEGEEANLAFMANIEDKPDARAREDKGKEVAQETPLLTWRPHQKKKKLKINMKPVIKRLDEQGKILCSMQSDIQSIFLSQSSAAKEIGALTSEIQSLKNDFGMVKQVFR